MALGATDVVDASAGDAVAAVRALTGGVDVALEATGVAAVVAQAVAMLGRGGTAVAIGVPAPVERRDRSRGARATDGAAYPNKVRLTITDGGDPVPEDFATWLGWAADGRLDLGAMVSRVAPLTEDDAPRGAPRDARRRGRPDGLPGRRCAAPGRGVASAPCGPASSTPSGA